ncbi:unnamed protein product, partial [Mesorhabditis spiculigera]
MASSRGRQARGFGSAGNDSTSASLFDAVFSKPPPRRAPRPFPVDEDNALPSVVSDAPSSSASSNPPAEQKMMSPPVSLPESTSTDGGDMNIDNSPASGSGDASDDDVTMDGEEVKARPGKHPRVDDFDFGEDEEEIVQPPAPKRAKSPEEPALARILPKKEARPVYRHVWSAGDGSDEEAEKPVETSRQQPAPVPTTAPTGLFGRTAVPIYKQRVRNVKDAHQCLEIGEQDHYKQDLTYILTSLGDPKATVNTKCLSAISLAKKCTASDFRQFIRTKGLIGSIFRALLDAPSDPNFALCAATLVYLMCRDQISVKVDANTLRLMVSLLKIEQVPRDATNAKYHAQICDIFKTYVKNNELAGQKMVFNFDDNEITPSSLTLEALVYALARNSEEAVKTELLNLGTMQWLVATVEKLVRRISGEELSDAAAQKLLQPLERCFRILETCTVHHKKNQAFLVSHRGSVLLHACAKFLEYQHKVIASHPPNSEFTTSQIGYLTILARVLMNLSHENELCCTKLGQIEGFLQRCLISFTYLAPKFASEEKKFDVHVMMPSLLVNLVERCASNRRKIIANKVEIFDVVAKTECELPVLEALTKLFLAHEEAAKAVDEDLDNDLMMEEPDVNEEEPDEDEDGARTDGRLDRNQLEDMTEHEMLQHVEVAMNKASAHMEDSVIASYMALLVGCLLQQNEDAAARVREMLPNGRLDSMIEQLNRFLEFMKIVSTKKSSHSIGKIVEYMERMNAE